ncbi:hypothetical protein [Streptomyces sp. NBC_01217]|uniref:hypothetical protein n=1 Tax=Streptomyces sp. NBC_01217 TaxID=2903779 RepID=UPI002E15525E
MQVWFITGVSRGFGLEIARRALETGNAVVATARNPKQCTGRCPTRATGFSRSPST